MARFNTSTAKVNNAPNTINLAGGLAYSETSEIELVSLLLTSFVQNQFYRDSDEQINKVRELVQKVDPYFAAQAAVFARDEFGMRSITHVTAGEIAHLPGAKGKEWTKRFYNNIVVRPDDMMEVLSYYINTYGKPIPNALKKGFAIAFDKFDAYQLAKYKAEGKKIKLVDVINTVHPKPSNQMVSVNRKELLESLTFSSKNTKSILYKEELKTRINGLKKNNEDKISVSVLEALVRGLLKNTETWESKLSEAGKAESEEDVVEAKKDAWVELIREKKLGYFALLKNLKNLVNQAPEVLDEALEQLVDVKKIKNSRVLPFRFQTAMNELKAVNAPSKVIKALSKALDLSVANVPIFEGNTLVVVDHSGSMGGPVGKSPNTTRIDVAALFAAAIYKTQKDVDLILFSEKANYLSLNPNDSVSTLMDNIKIGMNSAGTNFNTPFYVANKKYDRIMIFSDMQGWMGLGAPVSSYRQYCAEYNANPHLYSWDLSGLGSLMFPENKVYALAGFSDKVFQLMSLLENDKKALINKIKQVEI